MKKNVSKLMLSAVTMLLVITLIGSIKGNAIETPDDIVEVQGDTIQTQLQSNLRTMFLFRERTRLTVCANIDVELDINCEALRIGDKDVIIELEGDANLQMTMTCTREENQLGLMNGSLHRARNRNTYRYLEGFCIALKGTADCNCECKCDPDCECACDCPCECDPVCNCECNCQCDCDPECKCNSECPNDGTFLKTRLRIRETNQNRQSQWAYYNNENNEWVTVPTINQDGYLTAESNVLSTWTLLVPEETSSTILGTVAIVSVSVLGLLAISVFYFKKRH